MTRSSSSKVSYLRYIPVVGLTFVLVACGIVAYRQASILRDIELIQGVTEPEEEGQSKVDDTTVWPVPFEDDAAFRDELSLVKDRSLELRPREMGAYWRLMREQRSRSFEELDEAARPNQSLATYFQDPGSVRGALVTHKMTVRRVLTYRASFEKGEEPRTIYEIWGSTERAKNWLFVLVASELPEGFDEKSIVKTRVQIVGYFLKLQGYHPAAGKSSDRPLAAPLIIGKLKSLRERTIEPEAVGTPYLYVGVAALAIGSLLGCFLLLRWRRKPVLEGDRPVLPSELDWIAEASAEGESKSDP